MRRVRGIEHRISYYVRKCAEYDAVRPHHPQPRAYKYRHERLLAYKAEMHRRIEAAKQADVVTKVECSERGCAADV